MIEKKKMWVVTRSLDVRETGVIVEDGNVTLCNEGAYWYKPTVSRVLSFHDTEDEALAQRDAEVAAIRKTMQTTKEFLSQLRDMYPDKQVLELNEKDFLGPYAKKGESNYKDYRNECLYAEKLESYIQSGLLNMGGLSFAADQVKCVKWYFNDNYDEYDSESWQAELTLADGQKVKTATVYDIRLVQTVLGKCIGTYFPDDTIDYHKDED